MRFSSKKLRGAGTKTLATLFLLTALDPVFAQAEGGMAAEMARIKAAAASGQAAAQPFILKVSAAVTVGDGKTGAAAAQAAIKAAITPILVEQYSAMGLSAAASATGSGPK